MRAASAILENKGKGTIDYMNPLARLKKTSGNEFAFKLSEENNPYAVKEWVDTGCYALNAALSDADIFSGIPRGKRIGIAGPSGVAKSYFTLYIVKAYLDRVPNSYCVAFESEGSSIIDMAKSIGVDMDRVLILPVSTVQEFKIQVVKLLDDLMEEKKKGNKEENNYIFLLDSLGMLASDKEVSDARSGEIKADFTRAKEIRSIFRAITLKLSLTQTPLLVVNHTYDTIETYSKKETSGGDGYKYACDVSLILTKAQEKEGTEQIGSIISLNIHKSRYIPEGQKFKVVMLFKKGLFRHSNLLELAIELGMIDSTTSKGWYIFNDGRKLRKKEIFAQADTIFSGEFLQELRDKIRASRTFGGGADDVDPIEVDDAEE